MSAINIDSSIETENINTVLPNKPSRKPRLTKVEALRFKEWLSTSGHINDKADRIRETYFNETNTDLTLNFIRGVKREKRVVTPQS